MGDRHHVAPPSSRRRLLVALAFAAGLGLSPVAACSLLVETRDQQCTVDADCSHFASAHCDLVQHVCAPRSGSSSGGGAGSSQGSSTASTAAASSSGAGCNDVDCFSCPPMTTREFLNACTDAGCQSFANEKRLKHLLADGGVPPLPALPAGDGG